MDAVDGPCLGKMERKEKEKDDLENGANNAQVAFMPVQKYEKHYKMNHKHRGLAYIFNHQVFQECPERHGTKEDAQLLSKTLNDLNFEVNLFTDLYHREVMHQIAQAVKFNHSDYDCFLLVILTHGNSNLLWAQDKPYEPHEIFDKFTAEKCPTLAGKPKIFILQACQGTKSDPGITLIERTETDGLGGRRRRYRIPVWADFLIIYATFKGYYAFRNNTSGSYFILILCDELSRRASTDNILTILTYVNQRVAVDFASYTTSKDLNDRKQMPYFHCSLTRLLQFEMKSEDNQTKSVEDK